MPLATVRPDDQAFLSAGEIAYATARMVKLLLLLAITLFCTLIYEVTHDLGTQLLPTATPSKPGRPHCHLALSNRPVPEGTPVT